MEFIKARNPTLSPAINRTGIDSWGRAEIMTLYRIHEGEMSGHTMMESAVRFKMNLKLDGKVISETAAQRRCRKF